MKEAKEPEAPTKWERNAGGGAGGAGAKLGSGCRGRWMRLWWGRGLPTPWGHQERTAIGAGSRNRHSNIPQRRAVWEPTPLRKFGTLHPEYIARIKD